MARCGGCYDDPMSLLSVENVLQCQKVADFLIALAYLSIPLELFYFVTCASIFPFRWVLLQFGAFIVLCGLTHLAATFTYGPHSFLLVLALTVLKFLTALVSVATAITLVTLIPQLLRLFVREGLLRRRTRELRMKVGDMKRQEEAGWHVRMLTREIRRSLDRHTILYTTLVELSKALFLEHCAIWMPATAGDPHFQSSSSASPLPQNLVLTHEMRRRDLMHTRGVKRHRGGGGGGRHGAPVALQVDDPDVASVIQTKGVVLLEQRSRLICTHEEEEEEENEVGGARVGRGAAIRMPLLRAANFKGGTPEALDAPYAILVLVLAADRMHGWTPDEVEMIEVVADQVAVALSHAAVLEDSLAVKEELMERNMMLKQERQSAEMANQARILFQQVMSREIAAPIRSIEACLSALQLEKLSQEQMAAVKGGLVLSSLIEDAANPSRLENDEIELKLRPFNLHLMVMEAARVSRLLCAFCGAKFECLVDTRIPKRLVGDERRVLQAVLYMVGNVLGCIGGGDKGTLVLDVGEERGAEKAWKQNLFVDDFVKLRFRVGRVDSLDGESWLKSSVPMDGEGNQTKEGHGFCLSICMKLAELMHGYVSVKSSQGLEKNINLLIRLQQEQQIGEGALRLRYFDQETALTLLRGMRVLLGDGDGFNRNITRKVLEKTGCQLTVATSWFQCSEALYKKANHFHLLLLDLRITEDCSDISGKIQKLHTENWVLIVALAPNCSKEMRERGLQMGMHGLIRAPVVLQELVEELQRITQHLQTTPSLL